MEGTDTSATGGSHHHQNHQQQPQLPPGFRFHPTDEELMVHYLMRKAQSSSIPVPIIAELDLYKFDPWELPAKAVFGEHEWYFFSPRDRKYPNGARPNRAATSGYWKATGTDKPVFSAGNKKVGVKKALVFYGGKPPRGQKTNWIMHEYRLVDNNNNRPPPYVHSSNKTGSPRLDDWVLCRIYKKNNAHRPTVPEREDSMEEMNMMVGSMAKLTSSINSNNTNNLTKSSYDYINRTHNDHDQGIWLPGMIGNHQHQGIQIDPTTTVMGPSSLSHLTPSLPLKRAQPSLHWGGPSSTKRVSGLQDYHDNDNNNVNSNNINELMNQQTLLGALSDGGVFRQPYKLSGLNWY